MQHRKVLPSAFFVCPETDMQSYDAAAAPMPDHESASRMTEEANAAPKTEGWKVDSVNIRQAKNGGFIVSCSKSRQSSGKNDNMPTYQSNDYAFSTLDEVAGYLAQEFGASPEGGTTEGGGSGQAPMPMRAA